MNIHFLELEDYVNVTGKMKDIPGFSLILLNLLDPFSGVKSKFILLNYVSFSLPIILKSSSRII